MCAEFARQRQEEAQGAPWPCPGRQPRPGVEPNLEPDQNGTTQNVQGL